MFETTFQQSTATPLPPNVSVEAGVGILHDFETVIRLSPDCRGCKPVPSPNEGSQVNGDNTDRDGKAIAQHYEVEDDLPFIPKRLWSGGVKYLADFVPVADGCDITIHAPGGFTSTNHWRLLRETIHEDRTPTLQRMQSKDLLHADTTGGSSGWYVQIVSDAKCSRTFAGFVKSFLKNNQQQLQKAFIERVQTSPTQHKSTRPVLGRRKSSEF